MAVDVTLKALALWAVILLFAMANGALREAVLIPKLGSAPGLVLSGALLSGLVLLVAYLGLPWLHAHGGRELALVGLAWLIATLIFEFSFGLLRGEVPRRDFERVYLQGGQYLAFGAPNRGHGAVARGKGPRRCVMRVAPDDSSGPTPLRGAV